MLLENSGMQAFAAETVTAETSSVTADENVDTTVDGSDNSDGGDISNGNANDNIDDSNENESATGEDSDDNGDNDGNIGEDGENIEDNEDDANETVDAPEEEAEDTGEEGLLRSEAEKAFADLASEKNLMALIYLTDIYSVRSQADETSVVVAELESGHTVYLRGVTIAETQIWYRVQFWWSGTEMEGYVQQQYLAYADEDWRSWESEYLTALSDSELIAPSTINNISTYAASYSDVEQFPAGYQKALTQLKAAHPNWIFVRMNTNLDFNTAVSNEMGDKSLIQPTANNKEKGWVGDPCPKESGWNYATKDAVAYYMDPRNFLTETYVFQFEQLTFNSSYHTVDAIQTFLNSTFMKGTLSDDSQKRTYAQAFYEIGSSKKLSPIHLASRVYQEQGQGTSGLISGTYPGYEGYYNYFNVGVNGSSTEEKIKKGLTYAKEKGWNTRYKSLEGGSDTIGKNYILKGQDTIYLEKFNVGPGASNPVYTHQYMQNIQAPASESSTTKKMYTNAGSLNSAFVFKIPVYNNMPGLQPELKLNKSNLIMNKGESQTLTASVDGIEPTGKEIEIKWKSSDTSVISFASDNPKNITETIIAKSVGTATVTATYKASDDPGDIYEATCTIVVKNPLQQITLNKQEVTLRRPDTVVEDTTHLTEEAKQTNTSTVTLQVFFDPEDTTDDKTITWSSSNKKVATVTDPVVTEDGIYQATVTAVGSGQATITAKASKAGNKTAKCAVTVIAPIYRIDFSENNVDTILVGQSTNLTAEYFPMDTTSDTTVLWSSSDTSVINIVSQSKGTVKGIKAGTATITASIGGYQASYKMAVESCTVTFKNPDGGTAKEIPTAFGETIAETDFPKEDEFPWLADTSDKVFIGWYTGPNGTGSRFDTNTLIHQKETVLYPYFEELGKGFYVIPIGDQVFTGSAIKPTVQVYDSVSYENGSKELTPLTLNKDYTVSYKNNKNVNVEGSTKLPTITIKGKGNYSGTETVTFNIIAKPLTDADITADNLTVAYTGKTIKSNPVVYRNGKKLTKNTHYTVSYPQAASTGAYKNAGTYPITITGKGGYSGSITVYETITKDVLMSKVSIAKIKNQTYDASLINKDNNKGIEPELTVTYKKKPLQRSTDNGKSGDYTVNYSNNLDIGTATATITAIEGSGYVGSKSITFKITGTSISKAVINGVSAKTYTADQAAANHGSNDGIVQDSSSISVTLAGVELKQSTDNGKTGDYIVSYSNNTKAGTATVVIKGINSYTGTKKKTFKINAYDIAQDALSENPAIKIKYCTEDEIKAASQQNIDIEQLLKDKPFISSLNKISSPYMKGGAKPKVYLYYFYPASNIDTGADASVSYQLLEQSKDFTISYKNNNTVIDTVKTLEENPEATKLPTLTIKGKGNYKGTITGTFSITDGRLSDSSKITMTAKDVVYKPKAGAYKTSVVLTDANGKKLQAGKDYEKTLIYTYNSGDEVQPTDIPDVGTTIKVSVKGMGPYAGNEAEGTLSALYRITNADISKAKVKQVVAKTYVNGNTAITLNLEGDNPDITVTLNGETLVYGKDYVLDPGTYANNMKKGKATVVLKGIGNYGGTKKISFTIGSKVLSWWKKAD
ncbi:MAG: Ig-like domain-containing protein [Lachnospiraceae bacterium]|nr:Ig-like domain-containing protein [Lachnospiraceae bacterium]